MVGYGALLQYPWGGYVRGKADSMIRATERKAVICEIERGGGT